MELLKQDVCSVVEHTYTIQHPKEGVVVYKEWVDHNNVVIDYILRSKHGYEIESPVLRGEILEFVDETIQGVYR